MTMKPAVVAMLQKAEAALKEGGKVVEMGFLESGWTMTNGMDIDWSAEIVTIHGVGSIRIFDANCLIGVDIEDDDAPLVPGLPIS